VNRHRADHRPSATYEPQANAVRLVLELGDFMLGE
jgi:hypothetical protein